MENDSSSSAATLICTDLLMDWSLFMTSMGNTFCIKAGEEKIEGAMNQTLCF